jgi:hypothetical protein
MGCERKAGKNVVVRLARTMFARAMLHVPHSSYMYNEVYCEVYGPEQKYTSPLSNWAFPPIFLYIT